MQTLKYYMWLIMHWDCFGKYSKVWDAKLNKLLDNFNFVWIDRHHAEIGGIKLEGPLRISSHDLGFMLNVNGSNIRPSLKTIYRATKAYRICQEEATNDQLELMLEDKI